MIHTLVSMRFYQYGFELMSPKQFNFTESVRAHPISETGMVRDRLHRLITHFAVAELNMVLDVRERLDTVASRLTLWAQKRRIVRESSKGLVFYCFGQQGLRK